MNYQRLAVYVLAFVGVLTLGAIWQLQHLNFDYEFEDYFPKSDSDFQFYENYRSTFGSDNDFILFSITRKAGVFDQGFLTQVDSFAQALKRAPHIASVISPTELFYPVNTAFGLQKVHWFHLNDSSRLVADSIKIVTRKELMGTFIAEDMQSVRVVANTTYGLSKAKSDAAVSGVQEVMSAFDFEQIRPAGRIFGQRYYVDKMRFELLGFTSISALIIIIFLFFAFRSAWGIFAPLTVVAISVIWLMGFMTLMGKSFDIMSSLLPTIMFVVGISDAVHIVSRYLEELRVIPDQLRALKIAFKQIGKATFLTSLTTAFGFLTLLTSGITPVRDFGLYTAIGVLFAFAITFMILPAILLLLPIPKRTLVRGQNLFWNRVMRGVFRVNLKYPKRVLAVSAAIFVLALWGISQVSVNNYLLEDLPADDPMRENFEFFEEHYSGARPFEVCVTTSDGSSVLTLDRLHALKQIEQLFIHEFQLSQLYSIVTVMENLNRAEHGGAQAYYSLPENGQELHLLNKDLKRFQKTGKLQAVLSTHRDSTRMSAQVKDFGGKAFQEKYAQLAPKIQAITQQHGLQLSYTGMAYLIDQNNAHLATDLMVSILVAFMLIAIIMGFIFKSFKMVVITLIPNMLPLILIGGVMGALGIDLKISTSIIFTIAFGIAVDDTIHYVSKLRLELDKGKSVLYALKRTSISTGKAIVLTSLILISGFIALVFSTFASTFYIGILVSLTLVFAVLADLFLLPVLIFLGYRK